MTQEFEEQTGEEPAPSGGRTIGVSGGDTATAGGTQTGRDLGNEGMTGPEGDVGESALAQDDHER